MTLSESYQELHVCLYNILTKQFKKVGNTKLDAEFTMPYNTTVKVTSEQKRDLKTDIQMIIFSKINELDRLAKNCDNFYEKNENFHKLVIYKEIANEIEKLI